MDMCFILFFFFKQKTAYEMRISDWSSDVCSSDLRDRSRRPVFRLEEYLRLALPSQIAGCIEQLAHPRHFRRSIGQDQRFEDGAQPCLARSGEIGRASCRERVCQYV